MTGGQDGRRSFLRRPWAHRQPQLSRNPGNSPLSQVLRRLTAPGAGIAAGTPPLSDFSYNKVSID